jgi:hypothetical protein
MRWHVRVTGVDASLSKAAQLAELALEAGQPCAGVAARRRVDLFVRLLTEVGDVHLAQRDVLVDVLPAES